jgi:hypothetical protein
MIVYTVTHENTKTEFLQEQDAILFAQQFSAEIVQEEKSTIEQSSLPDVTPRQIRQALILMGVNLQQIEDALNSLPEPTKSLARIEWEYSIAFQRNRDLVSQMGAMLGWTSAQLDSLWILAAKL